MALFYVACTRVWSHANRVVSPNDHDLLSLMHTFHNSNLLPTNSCFQSDHPVVNSRYLLHEAAQAHYYGLDPALALRVTPEQPSITLLYSIKGQQRWDTIKCTWSGT
jgi:hypothetical protein